MSVTVDECVFKGVSSDTIILGFGNDDDNIDCQTDSVIDGVHSLSASLDKCGTNIDEVDGILVFNNRLTVVDRQSTFGLVMSVEVDIPLTCGYSTIYNTQVTDINIFETVNKISGLSSIGQFNFEMVMTNQDFTSELSSGPGSIIKILNYDVIILNNPSKITLKRLAI